MTQIVDLTNVGPNLPMMTREANKARAVHGNNIEGFILSDDQIDLLEVRVQSSFNRRTSVKRKDFMGVPIIMEGEE